MTTALPLLIEVRGAGGSGKTTVARRIMRRYLAPARSLSMTSPLVIETLSKGRCVWDGSSELVPCASEEDARAAADRLGARRRPRVLGVEFEHPEPTGRPLVVLGAQGIECGGVDTIPNMDIVYALADQHLAAGRDVLVEGRIFSLSAVERPLRRKDHLVVVLLTSDADLCVAATLERRRAAGVETSEERLANIRSNIEIGVAGSARVADRLAEAGARVLRVDREGAVDAIAELLGVADRQEQPWSALGLDESNAAPARPASEALAPAKMLADSQLSIGFGEPSSPHTVEIPAAARAGRRRSSILVTGPNCSGKTTAVRTAVRGLDPSRVRVIHADQELNSGPIESIAQRLDALWGSDIEVLVLEGIDRGARAVAAIAPRHDRELEVHVTTMEPEVMRQHLEARCAARGKTFRSEYWTRDRLLYEGQKRYANLAARHWANAEFWPIDLDYDGARRLAVHLQRSIEERLA